MLVALGLFVAAGMGTIAGLVLVFALLVFVWMVTVDSDSFLIVVLIAGALLWAGEPRDVSHDRSLDPTAGEPYFLVLGDSYISGEGAQKYYAGTNTTKHNAQFTNECRRAKTTCPNL